MLMQSDNGMKRVSKRKADVLEGYGSDSGKPVKDEEDDPTEPPQAETKPIPISLPTSFHASQEGPLPVEEQFDIQDETSQKTLETLVCKSIREA
jgi:hypothetical protein